MRARNGRENKQRDGKRWRTAKHSLRRERENGESESKKNRSGMTENAGPTYHANLDIQLSCIMPEIWKIEVIDTFETQSEKRI